MIAFLTFLLFASAYGGRSALYSGGVYDNHASVAYAAQPAYYSSYGSSGYGSGYGNDYGYGSGLGYSSAAYEAPAVSYVARPAAVSYTRPAAVSYVSRPAAVSYVQPASYSSYGTGYGSGYGLGSGLLGYSAGYNTPSVSSYHVRGDTSTVGATGGLRYASNYAAAPVSYVSSGYGSYGSGYGLGYGTGYGTGAYGGHGSGLTTSYSSGPGYSYSY